MSKKHQAHRVPVSESRQVVEETGSTTWIATTDRVSEKAETPKCGGCGHDKASHWGHWWSCKVVADCACAFYTPAPEGHTVKSHAFVKCDGARDSCKHCHRVIGGGYFNLCGKPESDPVHEQPAESVP